jgi:hypothetical protein
LCVRRKSAANPRIRIGGRRLTVILSKIFEDRRERQGKGGYSTRRKKRWRLAKYP